MMQLLWFIACFLMGAEGVHGHGEHCSTVSDGAAVRASESDASELFQLEMSRSLHGSLSGGALGAGLLDSNSGGIFGGGSGRSGSSVSDTPAPEPPNEACDTNFFPDATICNVNEQNPQRECSPSDMTAGDFTNCWFDGLPPPLTGSNPCPGTANSTTAKVELPDETLEFCFPVPPGVCPAQVCIKSASSGVLCYDGIENCSAPTKDPSTTVCTNYTGSGDFCVVATLACIEHYNHHSGADYNNHSGSYNNDDTCTYDNHDPGSNNNHHSGADYNNHPGSYDNDDTCTYDNNDPGSNNHHHSGADYNNHPGSYNNDDTCTYDNHDSRGNHLHHNINRNNVNGS
ncbi:Dagla [Symbiodinium necroappetens]|uniref:Dagla protein n=1 Tax=Symbiodinium necroappetens TaxID=1628268 RepID=A0A813BLU8_9DINO|nr:Dagla [Symbiodinium necroappetens]